MLKQKIIVVKAIALARALDKERWQNYAKVRLKEIKEAIYQEVMKMVVLDRM